MTTGLFFLCKRCSTMPGPVADVPLVAGQSVVVRDLKDIAATLNGNGRNKGPWFDPCMIKHCHTKQTVLARVTIVVDDANGEMRQMKTPCILLDSVEYSGQFLDFNAQHDLFFWRESWLRPADHPQGASR